MDALGADRSVRRRQRGHASRERAKRPLAAILLRHWRLVGVPWLELIKSDPYGDLLARLGVLLLLVEVRLIFANIGLASSVNGVPIVDRSTFSAVVMMVIVTTIITPPALAWRFSRLA